MKIPFFDLKRQYNEVSEEMEREVISVLRSGAYIEGTATKELERKLAEYIGVKHVITCGNGTDALRIALQAIGVKLGDEVITTSFSFFATAEAIAQIGAVPVFADIDYETLNIDVENIESLITKKTKAILPVHIFGRPAQMDEINAIAAKHNIPVVEDACQAIGASLDGVKTGALGNVGCFSFYPTKNLGAAGDGGFISTNDDNIAKACRAYKSHAAGKNGAEAYSYLTNEVIPELEEMKVSENGLYDPCKYYNYFVGGNSRLDSVQAACLNVKLPKLNRYNAKRAAIAQKYLNKLTGLPIKLPLADDAKYKSCWHQFAILVDEKEEFVKYMEEQGIGIGAFYPVPLHLQKSFTNLDYREGKLPVVEMVCKKSVCLPIFPELTDDETDYIIEAIKAFYANEREE